jgi:hypothetical protein
MAPVAGGVADREKDRLLLLSGTSERLLSPWVPLHGILRVLEKVGGGARGEVIHRRKKRMKLET